MIIRGIMLFAALSAGVLGATPETEERTTSGWAQKIVDSATSAAQYVANGLNDSFGRGRSTPTKKTHSTESLDNLLAENTELKNESRLVENLFTTPLPNDLANFVITHPTIAKAIAASCRSYKDDDIEKKHPSLNLATVRKYIEDSGFKVEELDHDVVLLTRDTAEGIREAWFSVKGTHSIGSALTCLGIGAHCTSSDYDQTLRSIISSLSLPEKMVRVLNSTYHFFCTVCRNLGSYSEENFYHFICVTLVTTQICVFLSKIAFINHLLNYGYETINLMKCIYLSLGAFGYYANTYDYGFMTMISVLSIGSAAILSTNIIPKIVYRLRYKEHLTRLYNILRHKVIELERDGYQVSFSGHSLGGHVVQILGLLLNKRAFSFNAPGGALKHARWMHRDLGLSSPLPTARQFEESILPVIAAGDPISSLQHEGDPVDPIVVALNGAVGLDAHRILPLHWACGETRI